MTRSLVTGATGYIGSRLVPELLDAGHTVRALVRDEGKARQHPWADDVELAVGDATSDDDVRQAMQGVDVLYYLLHSIDTGGDFGATEREIAERFARAAEDAGVRRIVYLGGMIPEDEELSEHLASRKEVGDVLLSSRVPATVLQAGVVIGSGSASFEMLRHLTERLPVMVTPTWVSTRIQPIAVEDVLRYLAGSADMPDDVNRRFDVGGPDVLTYLDLMQRFAAVSGLPRRRIVKVPVLSPGLSSHWVGLVTPVPASLARPLVESLRNTVVAGDDDVKELVPDPPGGLLDFDTAVERALTSTAPPAAGLPTDPDWAGEPEYALDLSRHVDATPEAVWASIERFAEGALPTPAIWRARDRLDRLTGSATGVRWRLDETEAGVRATFRAEARLPGTAHLTLSIEPAGSGTTLRLRVRFGPKGLLGHAYWWTSRPFDGYAFGAIQATIADDAKSPRR